MYDLRTKFTAAFSGDLLALAATAFVIFFCLLSSHSYAGVDLNVGGSFRSYPVSGVGRFEAGYGQIVWGDNANSNPFYGYVRTKVEGHSALIYNSIGGAVEVFPLSFLGFRAGGDAIQNDKDYISYDCDVYACKGRFYKTYAEGELTLGAGRFFVQGKWRRERWTQKDAAAASYVDPTSGLLMLGSGDSQTIYSAGAGYKVNDTYTVIGGLRYAESAETDGLSRFPFALVLYKHGQLSIGAGAGIFESSLKDQGAAGLAMLRWDISKSVALQ